MSSIDLPEDVVEDILTRLPVKSLLRFRCVCRSWSIRIRKPSFVAKHLHFNRTSRTKRKFIFNPGHVYSLVSDETFSHSEDLNFPFSEGLQLQGYCDGIVCAAVYQAHFLWNPATREYKVFPDSCIRRRDIGSYFVGFGFDPKTDDYKAVRIVYLTERLQSSFVHSKRAEVYSLKTDSWKEIQPLPNHVSLGLSICYNRYVNGFLLWDGTNYKENDATKVIILFDLSNELLRTIETPPLQTAQMGRATALNDSIAYIAKYYQCDSAAVDVWLMNEFRDAGSWVKHFSIASIPQPLAPIGLVDTTEILCSKVATGELAYYCFLTGKVTNLQVHLNYCEFINYRESLVSIRGGSVLNIYPDILFFLKLNGGFS